MELLLKDKVAVVTGAGQGIGEGIALELAKRGANIVIADIDLDGANSAVKKVESLGVKSIAVKMNVIDRADIKNCIKTAIERFGRIDIWVNNAGIAQEKPIEEITEEDWDRLLAIDLKSVYMCSQEAYEIMKAQNYGRIINISSGAGLVGGAVGGIHYSAAKGGSMALTRDFASRVAKYNINVNAIAPGTVITEMARKLGWDKKSPTNPRGVWGTPEDIGKAVVFLASDLSDHITGQTICVNGGSVMR